MKKVLLLVLTLVLVLGMAGSGTFSLFSDTEASLGNTITAWSSRLWTQTTQTEFEAGVPVNVDTSSSPGDVILAGSSAGYITDEYYDYDLLTSWNNLVIVEDHVQLASSGTTATERSRPTKDVDIELTRSSGNKNYECVDEEDPHDGDSSYVYASTAGTYLTDIYQLGFTPNGNITKVTIYMVARFSSNNLSDTANARTAIQSGPNKEPIYGVPEILSSNYLLYSSPYYINPDTNKPWTQGDIQSLYIGVSLMSTSTAQARCTQVYAEITYGEGGFLSPGTLISENLLDGLTNTSIDGFSYYAPSIPEGTTLQVQFSRDSSNWYNSAGVSGGWDAMSEGTNTINLTGLGWSGPYFYYKVIFTTDSKNLYTPILDYVTVNYSSGYPSGTIASQVFDTTILGATWDLLSWDETLPAGTDITFEVRASDTAFAKDDITLPWTSVGGTSPVMSGLPSGQYKQWRATLTTTDTDVTPVLHEVRVWYDP